MRIYSMTATFGKLEQQTLTLQPGLNVIHAPNEWGKSTWCAFLVAMLYGIETRAHTTKTVLADKERYAPWSGSPMSGRIDLHWQGRDITIERRSKGRSVFGQFRAYETDSGLEVSELTGDNCGKLLLGVEKSVFLRAGFLQLSDLPVTEDEALRRRLNALVTTGDESGTADALAQKLRDLKNRCRANRSSGLLPQLENRRNELEDKLRQLGELHEQSEQLRQREHQLEAYHAQLRNHRAALAYAASRTYSDKLLGAKNALAIAQAQCHDLERQCVADPDIGQLEQKLRQLQQLRQQRDALTFDAQLLELPGEAPDVPEPYREISGTDAGKQAKADYSAYEKASAVAKKCTLLILGALLAAGGIAGLLMGQLIVQLIGIAALLGGLGCILTQLIARKRAQGKRNVLLKKYGDIPPENWVEAASYWTKTQTDYAGQLENHRLQLAQLRQRRRELDARILELTAGTSLPEYERQLQEAGERQKQLLEARRELQRRKETVQTLQISHAEASPPTQPDTMTFTEPETLHLLGDCESQQRLLKERQGHLNGLMEALGQEADLLRELSQIRERIARTEDMLIALEIAQGALSDAASELQRRFAPRISQRAKALFGQLTDGRYDRLTLDADLSVQTGTREEATVRSALWRSEGTMDQLYLALRLAVAEELTPHAPLILDDALVRFDDTRLQRAMELLRREAETRQILLFTCQSREARALGTE